jgi:acyl-CoA thioester hydrolase
MNSRITFSIPMEVRDYECDLQGIVNNSVYLNYFEHTRHSFLKSIALDFHRLHTEGLDAVVRRVEIDYRRSLTGMDAFTSSLQISMKGRLQCVFDQSIHRQPDGEEMTKARTYVAFIRGGRPVPPPDKLVSTVKAWLAGEAAE